MNQLMKKAMHKIAVDLHVCMYVKVYFYVSTSCTALYVCFHYLQVIYMLYIYLRGLRYVCMYVSMYFMYVYMYVLHHYYY